MEVSNLSNFEAVVCRVGPREFIAGRCSVLGTSVHTCMSTPTQRAAVACAQRSYACYEVKTDRAGLLQQRK